MKLHVVNGKLVDLDNLSNDSIEIKDAKPKEQTPTPADNYSQTSDESLEPKPKATSRIKPRRRIVRRVIPKTRHLKAEMGPEKNSNSHSQDPRQELEAPKPEKKSKGVCRVHRRILESLEMEEQRVEKVRRSGRVNLDDRSSLKALSSNYKPPEKPKVNSSMRLMDLFK